MIGNKIIYAISIAFCLFSQIAQISGKPGETSPEIKTESEPEGERNMRILERVNFPTNKTVKILTGQNQNRPQTQNPQLTPPLVQSQSPQYQYPYPNNNYHQNQNQHQPQQMMNQYPPNYPQSPDLSGQGSGPQPILQQPQQPQQQPQEAANAIPEVYLQIIAAIEKLVGRMDKMDSRLQTLENIVLHLTNKKDEPKQGGCPENFVKVDGIRGKCFHISTLTKSSEKTVFDWKSAHAQCGKLGGRLAEMIHYDDYLRISQFLVKYSAAKSNPAGSSDFWVGGINPGLIWIWSESGQKVGMDRRFWNENDNSSNAPGCLKLSYSHRLDAFFFKGAPCMHSQNILCEVMDNSISRALERFEQELIDGESNKEMEM